VSVKAGRVTTTSPGLGSTTAAPPANLLGRLPPGRRLTALAAPTAVLIGLLAAWEAFVRVTHQPAYLIPGPYTISRTVADSSRSVLLPATWVTLREILLGFGLAIIVALPLATAVAHSKVASRSLYPLIIASQTIPVIAIAPILVIWFGFGATPKVLIAALISFFPITLNAIAGQNSVDSDSVNLMRSLSASRWAVFRKLTFPASLPYTLVGLKQAAVISVIGAVVGEWAGAEKGIGPVMLNANASFQTPLIFAAMVYLSAIGIALFGLVALAERLAVPWMRFTTRGR
jgi:NitT/TauT family transport system permease protein